jgi:hypothetical protein
MMYIKKTLLVAYSHKIRMPLLYTVPETLCNSTIDT